MRKFIIATVMAIGLVALWAAILPLTAQPAQRQTAVTATTVSKALFLCRNANGIDHACAAALAKALVLETSANNPTDDDHMCHANPKVLADLGRRG
jgi:hypothetical protein